MCSLEIIARLDSGVVQCMEMAAEGRMRISLHGELGIDTWRYEGKKTRTKDNLRGKL